MILFLLGFAALAALCLLLAAAYRPRRSVVCPRCGGTGIEWIVGAYAADCPVCGGRGWVVPREVRPRGYREVKR